jgi:hypothetical protein
MNDLDKLMSDGDASPIAQSNNNLELVNKKSPSQE